MRPIKSTVEAIQKLSGIKGVKEKDILLDELNKKQNEMESK